MRSYRYRVVALAATLSSLVVSAPAGAWCFDCGMPSLEGTLDAEVGRIMQDKVMEDHWKKDASPAARDAQRHRHGSATHSHDHSGAHVHPAPSAATRPDTEIDWGKVFQEAWRKAQAKSTYRTVTAEELRARTQSRPSSSETAGVSRAQSGAKPWQESPCVAKAVRDGAGVVLTLHNGMTIKDSDAKIRISC